MKPAAKKVSIVIAQIVLVLVMACHISMAANCAKTLYDAQKDRCVCSYSCLGLYGCYGCCYVLDNGNVCYAAGCCTYNPTVGGVCYDPSGKSCNNYACQVGTVPVTMLNDGIEFPLVEAEYFQNPVKAANWVQSSTFPSEIGQYSPMFQKVVQAFRLVATTRNAFDNLKDAQPRTLLVRTRKGFAVNATLSKWGDDWAITVDKADPLEPGHANVLDIIGSKWKLVRHPTTHTGAGERIIVAEGTVE